MSISQTIRKTIKDIAFGGNPVPQRIFLAQPSPQRAVSVWLHGMGPPLDVTYRHSMPLAAPFMLCLSFNKNQGPIGNEADRLSLKFCEQNGDQRVLGEIGLKLLQRIPLNSREFLIFGARYTANYCMPALRLWAHYLLYARAERLAQVPPDISFSFVSKRALEVIFLCPRPISLVSVITDIKGNMFPVNVMGDVDDGYFTFSLRSTKIPSNLVANAGRIALSSVPFKQGSFAYQMGVNYSRPSANWYELPFETKKSNSFQIPVPVFSYRVREMEIEKVQPLGGHIMFITRIVSDECYSDGQELFVAHGFYEAWRLRKSHDE